MTNAEYLKLAYIARKKATTYQERNKYQIIINKLIKAIKEETRLQWSKAC